MIGDFHNLWQGGYYEGNPLDPQSPSSYGKYSYMSILHATYLRCIKPYHNVKHNALEIGAGRGAWTRCLLPFKEVHVLEVLSTEETHILEELHSPPNLFYHEVHDFECTELPDGYFDYMFSFGCLCHISHEGIHEYAYNLYDKMRHGSNCFWMISDYATTGRLPDADELPRPGRWYDNKLTRVCDLLEEVGYSIYDRDVGTALRDPIIWFGRR